MYAVVRCRSRAVFELLRDDLIQRGQNCSSLESRTDHEAMPELEPEIDPQEFSNEEMKVFPEENGGVSALDLLGEDDEQDELDFEDESIFEEEKPKNFKIDFTEATKTMNAFYSIGCQVCPQGIRCRAETEWSQKCNHVLQHLVPARYECPYCGRPERVKGILYDHLIQNHNEGTMAVPIPAVREPSDARRFLAQLEHCFPHSEQVSLEIPSEHLTSDIHDVVYYSFVLKAESPRKYIKHAPVRLKCAKCNSCISKGPMEEQLKFEHALNHSHLAWITCSKCQATFTEKDSFFMHNRVTHQGGGFPICKDREDLSDENRIYVDRLVMKLFPKDPVVPLIFDERVPSARFLMKKAGPTQRKSRLKQVLPTEMEDDSIVHVKQKKRSPSVNIFDSMVKLEQEEGAVKRRSPRKRKLVAS